MQEKPSAQRIFAGADVVFVMENKHKSRLTSKFARMLEHKPLFILDIPDDYKYMDEELVSELKMKVTDVLAL